MQKFIFRYLINNGDMVFQLKEMKNSSEAFKFTIEELNRNRPFVISDDDDHYNIDSNKLVHVEFENYMH